MAAEGESRKANRDGGLHLVLLEINTVNSARDTTHIARYSSLYQKLYSTYFLKPVLSIGIASMADHKVAVYSTNGP